MSTVQRGPALQICGLTLLTILFMHLPARATIIQVPPENPGTTPHPDKIYIEHTDVTVRIHEGAAELRILQRVRNDSAQTQQTRYVLPIPKGARAHSASLRIGEDWVEAELLEAHDARGIYEEIVRRQIDPALVEHIEEGMLRTSIFPVPPHSTREIELSLNMTLPMEFDAWKLKLPLAALASGGRVEVHGDIRSKNELLEPYSPSHSIRSSLRGNSREASFEWNGDYSAQLNDLTLVLPFAPQRFGVFATSTRPAGDDGYVLLRLSPGRRLGGDRVLPKDLLFVLDTSGSMRGEKMRQAKAALMSCLDGLGEDDRFGLLSYAADVRPFGSGLGTATASFKEQARDAVQTLRADGGTNIEGALQAALEWSEDFESGRPAYIIFISDGLPTVGEQDIGKLLHQLQRRGDSLPRIFSFGVGHDVNTSLMDGIAKRSRANARYVLPGEDLEESIGRLYAQIAEPLWTDLELETQGLHDIIPRELGDLFAGESVTVLARYDDSGAQRMRLRGRRGGDRESFDFAVDLERGYGDADYLPKLWASKEIALIEEELRDHPDRDELRARLVELATRHGIVTSYTSLLMREGDEQIAQALRRGDFDQARERAQSIHPQSAAGSSFNAPAPTEGQAAVQDAARKKRVLSSMALDKVEAETEYKDDSFVGKNKLQVGGRYFERNEDGAWVDRLSAGGVERLKIVHGSEAFYELLRMRPDLRRILAQGTTMRIALGDAVLAIEENGKTQLSKRDRDWLATARL